MPGRGARVDEEQMCQPSRDVEHTTVKLGNEDYCDNLKLPNVGHLPPFAATWPDE